MALTPFDYGWALSNTRFLPSDAAAGSFGSSSWESEVCKTLGLATLEAAFLRSGQVVVNDGYWRAHNLVIS
jgi:hypothetical protein